MNSSVKNVGLVILQFGLTVMFAIGLFWFWQLPEIRNWYVLIAIVFMGAPVICQNERFWFNLTVQLTFIGLACFLLNELDAIFTTWGNIFLALSFTILFVGSYISIPGISTPDATDEFLNKPIIYWPSAIITTIAFLTAPSIIFCIAPEFWSAYLACLYELIVIARSMKSKLNIMSTMSD
mgnify:CR=1 FL=1